MTYTNEQIRAMADGCKQCGDSRVGEMLEAWLAERQAARDEWKLVPVEPTSEMLDAPKWTRIECERIYRAMLSAAPAYNGKKEG